MGAIVPPLIVLQCSFFRQSFQVNDFDAENPSIDLCLTDFWNDGIGSPRCQAKRSIRKGEWFSISESEEDDVLICFSSMLQSLLYFVFFSCVSNTFVP